jgi:hypothetical protein
MYFRVVLIEYISVMFQISFAVSFNKIILSCSRFWLLLQAIDHIINSAAKSNYMSAGQISVPIVFRGPNGAAAGVGAQHSHVWLKRFLIHLSFCKHTYSLSQAAHFILSLSLSLSLIWKSNVLSWPYSKSSSATAWATVCQALFSCTIKFLCHLPNCEKIVCLCPE